MNAVTINIAKYRVALLMFIAGLLYLIVAKPITMLRLMGFNETSWYFIHDTILGLIYCAIVFLLSYVLVGAKLNDFGFGVSKIKKSPGYWVLSSALFFLAIFIMYIVAINILDIFGYKFTPNIPSAADIPNEYMFSAFAWSPLFEEIVFRGILLTLLSMLIGRKPLVIIIGGSLFSAIHFYYGNPDPMNFVAGYFLCWVFYQTQSLILPCIFHLIGNVFCYSLSIIESYHPNFLDKLIAMLTIHF